MSDSGLAAPPLSDGSVVTAQSLGNFLQRVLIDHYDKIWFCPHMMSFIDDEKLSDIEDIRVKSLTKQVRETERRGKTLYIYWWGSFDNCFNYWYCVT